MLEVRNIFKTYGEGGARTAALRNVSFNVPDGDFVAITGPSGSGKSTLLNIVGCLDTPSSGEVWWDGRRIDHLSEGDLVDFRRKTVAYVFQQYHLIPSLNALENVVMPLTFAGTGGEGALERGLEMLRKVGLEKRARHRPGQLSGGEQQRVAIARALISGPSLVLADEPTGNVDHKAGEGIMRLFHDLNYGGRTILMVTHNPELAEQARRVIVMNDGELIDERRCQ
ncbi:MAG: ABC transporter ATP-binding protein [Chloroflexota bacterium]